jgi:hypothetical protein
MRIMVPKTAMMDMMMCMCTGMSRFAYIAF